MNKYTIKVYDGSIIGEDFECIATKEHLTEEKAYSLARKIAERISDVYGRSCVEILEEYETEDGMYLDLYDVIEGPYNTDIKLKSVEDLLNEED